jgi:DNA-binding HxlR family transcriptional regulator
MHAEVSPRVEYELSDLAATLIPHAVAAANWAVEHAESRLASGT